MKRRVIGVLCFLVVSLVTPIAAAGTADAHIRTSSRQTIGCAGQLRWEDTGTTFVADWVCYSNGSSRLIWQWQSKREWCDGDVKDTGMKWTVGGVGSGQDPHDMCASVHGSFSAPSQKDIDMKDVASGFFSLEYGQVGVTTLNVQLHTATNPCKPGKACPQAETDDDVLRSLSR